MLPNIRIIKEKAYYEEEFSEFSQSCFIFAENHCLFDGKHHRCHSLKKFAVKHGKLYMLQLTSYRFSPLIVELNLCCMRFIGPCFYLNPNGVCKIIFEGLIFKGNMKGLLNIGTCTVKNDFFKAFIECDVRGMKYPFTLISKELGFETSINYSAVEKCIILGKNGKNLEIAYNCYQQILEFVDKSTKAYNHIIKYLSKYGFSSNLISYYLVASHNWKSLEYDLKERKMMIDYSQGIIQKPAQFEEKILKVFQNNERYEGIVVNGEFEGLGKYFYSDGSVYIGEFKKNLRNGLGIFKFRDGRMYKGYWVNNMMHGKGLMINKENKFFGQWDKNGLLQGSNCIYNHLF